MFLKVFFCTERKHSCVLLAIRGDLFSLYLNVSWIINCMRKADKNEDNQMTLKELKHFLRQINVEVDDTYAEEIFKVSPAHLLYVLISVHSQSLNCFTSFCCIEMRQVQFRYLGGLGDQALLRPADTSGGDRCHLWEVR